MKVTSIFNFEMVDASASNCEWSVSKAVLKMHYSYSKVDAKASCCCGRQ